MIYLIGRNSLSQAKTHYSTQACMFPGGYHRHRNILHCTEKNWMRQENDQWRLLGVFSEVKHNWKVWCSILSRSGAWRNCNICMAPNLRMLLIMPVIACVFLISSPRKNNFGKPPTIWLSNYPRTPHGIAYPFTPRFTTPCPHQNF